MNVNLQEKAMLMKHTVRSISFDKQDKKVAEEIAERHGADKKNAGRYRKILVGEQFRQKIEKIGRLARDHHRTFTLPWEDEGSRILPATAYWGYKAAQNEFQEQYKDAGYELYQQWYDVLDDARTRLGDMFRAEDYPERDQIAERFVIELSPKPIPSGADFRVGLNDLEARMIREDIERRMTDVARNAITDLWRRLQEPLETLKDRLANYEESERRAYQSAWIDNVREVIKVIPALNFTGDQALIRLCREAELKICEFNSDQMRVSKATREFVRDAADDILRQMAGYIGEIQEAA